MLDWLKQLRTKHATWSESGFDSEMLLPDEPTAESIDSNNQTLSTTNSILVATLQQMSAASQETYIRLESAPVSDFSPAQTTTAPQPAQPKKGDKTMASKSERIDSALSEYISNNSTDVTGAALISSDGMLLGAKMSGDINADRVGAISSTMMGVTKRVVTDLKIGVAEETIVRAREGYLLVVPVTDQLVLATTLRPSANLGMIRLEARDASSVLSGVMS